MSITLGNPIVITSGTMNTRITDDKIKVGELYWQQPTLESTSTLIITKLTADGITYANMMVETSGESQVLDLPDLWMDRPFCRCMPTGNLYLYLLQEVKMPCKKKHKKGKK